MFSRKNIPRFRYFELNRNTGHIYLKVKYEKELCFEMRNISLTNPFPHSVPYLSTKHLHWCVTPTSRSTHLPGLSDFGGLN